MSARSKNKNSSYIHKSFLLRRHWRPVPLLQLSELSELPKNKLFNRKIKIEVAYLGIDFQITLEKSIIKFKKSSFFKKNWCWNQRSTRLQQNTEHNITFENHFFLLQSIKWYDNKTINLYPNYPYHTVVYDSKILAQTKNPTQSQHFLFTFFIFKLFEIRILNVRKKRSKNVKPSTHYKSKICKAPYTL